MNISLINKGFFFPSKILFMKFSLYFLQQISIFLDCSLVFGPYPYKVLLVQAVKWTTLARDLTSQETQKGKDFTYVASQKWNTICKYLKIYIRIKIL